MYVYMYMYVKMWHVAGIPSHDESGEPLSRKKVSEFAAQVWGHKCGFALHDR